MEIQLRIKRHEQELAVLKSTPSVGVSPWDLVTARYLGSSLQVHVARLPQQGPFRHVMDLKAEKRMAGRKERRSRFGDISMHKCYQFGQIFSPFQALATTVSKLRLGKGFLSLLLRTLTNPSSFPF